MVDPTNLLPKIEGFSPLPVSAVIPFMELQTRVMGIAFGSSMQIGKRIIGAMSNDKFNNLIGETKYLVNEDGSLNTGSLDEVLGGNIWKELSPYAKQAIDMFMEELPKYSVVQTEILNRGFDLEQEKMLKNVELFKWALTNIPAEYFTQRENDSNFFEAFTQWYQSLTGTSDGSTVRETTTTTDSTTSEPTTTTTSTTTEPEPDLTHNVAWYRTEIDNMTITGNTSNWVKLTEDERIAMFNMETTYQNTYWETVSMDFVEGASETPTLNFWKTAYDKMKIGENYYRYMRFLNVYPSGRYINGSHVTKHMAQVLR